MIVSGRQSIGVNDRIFELSAGQVLMILPPDIHYYEKIEETDGYLLIFPADILDSQLLQHTTMLTISNPAKISALTILADQLVNEIDQCKPQFALAAEGILKIFLAKLLRPDRDEQCLRVDSNKHPRAMVMQDILTYLKNNYREPIRRDILAARFHLSISHFTRIFKAASGLSLTEYLTRLRLENACRDISQTNLSITEIAMQNGFPSIRTFNRLFQKSLQRTPLSLRRSSAPVMTWTNTSHSPNRMIRG